MLHFAINMLHCTLFDFSILYFVESCIIDCHQAYMSEKKMLSRDRSQTILSTILDQHPRHELLKVSLELIFPSDFRVRRVRRTEDDYIVETARL